MTCKTTDLCSMFSWYEMWIRKIESALWIGKTFAKMKIFAKTKLYKISSKYTNFHIFAKKEKGIFVSVLAVVDPGFSSWYFVFRRQYHHLNCVYHSGECEARPDSCCPGCPCFHCLWTHRKVGTEINEWFIEGQAFSQSYDLAPRPPPPPLPSTSCISVLLGVAGLAYCRKRGRVDEMKGGGRSQIIQQRESLILYNHSILFSAKKVNPRWHFL